MLLEKEDFSHIIWEPACGEGHISESLKQAGHFVISSDIIDRGYGAVADFFSITSPPSLHADIITNPPYSQATAFIYHCLELLPPGHKLAAFLKLLFLEGKARRLLYEVHPPKVIYVSSSRLVCAKNGDFKRYKNSNAVAYAWYIWEKGYQGDTVIKWIN